MNEEENNDVNNLDKIIVAKRIAGDIVLSSEPGKTIQKWRNIFKVSQKKLADKIGVMPSVISDYENGRRQSPGIKMIRKIVNALIEIDEKYGGKVIKEFINMPNKTNKFSSIIDVADFRKGITIKDFCKVLDAIIIVGNENIENKIYGYTIVDTMKAILELPSIQFIQLYSLTNNRAIIFIGAHKGKSTMVALKVSNVKPGLVIFQSSEDIDDLARKIAELENIPIAIIKKDTQSIIDCLRKNFL